MSRIVSVGFLLLVFALSPSSLVAAADDAKTPTEPPLSLITATPEEGFQVALRLARKGVTETQSDRDVLFMLRDVYAKDPDALIAASHVVAVHFQTVAEANNYWRDGD